MAEFGLLGSTGCHEMTMQDSITRARLSGPTQQLDGIAVLEFCFGLEDPVFSGHFPERPLVPGVFQLEMARMAAEWVLGRSLAVIEVTKAKFQRPVVPTEIVRLELKVSEENDTIRARAVYSVGGKPAGETVLLLR